MSKINIKFMKKEVVNTIRGNLEIANANLISNPTNSDWLKNLGGQNIEDLYEIKDFEIDDFSLDVCEVKTVDTSLNNAIKLYESLKDLPAYILTDERFWCWLNFEKFYKFALNEIPPKEDKVSVLRDHLLFYQGKRRGLFFGSISRLFFRVFLSVDESLEDPYIYTRFIFENPDRFRNLSWRTFSGLKHLVLATLKAEKRVVDEFDFNEVAYYYETIAKDISRLGSVKILDVMDPEYLEEFVYNDYKSLILERNESLNYKKFTLD